MDNEVYCFPIVDIENQVEKKRITEKNKLIKSKIYKKQTATKARPNKLIKKNQQQQQKKKTLFHTPAHLHFEDVFNFLFYFVNFHLFKKIRKCF